MLEKRTMWYYDFEYPTSKPQSVTVFIDTKTNEVEVYDMGDTECYTPREQDHFYNTEEEAFDAMDKRKHELIDMMPTIKAYLNAIDNCKQDEDEDSFFRFNEDDFLGDFAYKVQRYDRYNYTYEDYNNVNHLADLLTDFVQTGFLNIKADSFRREDVERIKWGKKRAEVVLKSGKTIATCNQSEYWFIGRLFGTNHSTFSYTHLDKKEGDDDQD